MAFGFYRTLTIDHTKCGSSSSSSFPVLVKITGATSVKTVGNSGRINNTGTQTGGVGGTIPYDLVFSSDSAGSSKYPWEVEFYDGTAGTLVAWVQVPTVSNVSDIVFYMAYGDAAVNAQQNTSSFSPANVWDTNYKGVWHLTNGSSLASPTLDSTSNVNSGTLSATPPTATTGQIDGGAAFVAASSMDIRPGAVILDSDAFTYSAWIKTPASNTGPDFGRGLTNWNVAIIPNAGSTVLFAVVLSSGGAAQFNCNGTTTLAQSTWYYIAGVLTVGADIRVYVNGIRETTTTATKTGLRASPEGLLFGNSTSGFGTGTLDEVRISKSIRGPDWILTEYNDQNTPGNIGTPGFITFGAEVSTGGALAPQRTLVGVGL